jgi:hypothetical protein
MIISHHIVILGSKPSSAVLKSRVNAQHNMHQCHTLYTLKTLNGGIDYLSYDGTQIRRIKGLHTIINNMSARHYVHRHHHHHHQNDHDQSKLSWFSILKPTQLSRTSTVKAPNPQRRTTSPLSLRRRSHNSYTQADRLHKPLSTQPRHTKQARVKLARVQSGR